MICEDRGYQRTVDKTALFSFSFLFLFFTKTIFLSCLFALNYVKMSKQFDCYILITIFFLFCFSGFLCGFPSSKITLKSDSWKKVIGKYFSSTVKLTPTKRVCDIKVNNNVDIRFLFCPLKVRTLVLQHKNVWRNLIESEWEWVSQRFFDGFPSQTSASEGGGWHRIGRRCLGCDHESSRR